MSLEKYIYKKISYFTENNSRKMFNLPTFSLNWLSPVDYLTAKVEY